MTGHEIEIWFDAYKAGFKDGCVFSCAYGPDGKPKRICESYRDGRCFGTKEQDLCDCGGDKSKCDFYSP